MATQKCFIYCSDSRLACGSCLPADVILCLSTDKAAPRECPGGGDQPFVYSHIEASLVSQVKVPNKCGASHWKYTICYDEEQVVDGLEIQASDVSGIFCKGCLAQWVEDIVGAEIQVEVDAEEGTVTITSQHGCETTFSLDPVPVCVEDSQSIDFSLSEDGCVTGSVIISAEADNILELAADGLYVPDPGAGAGWLLLGNSGTIDGTNFLGTIDDIPLTLRVNNLRAFRIASGSSANAPNIIGGPSTNVISVNPVAGNFIGNGKENIINACVDGFIGAGEANTIAGNNTDKAFIGAGESNTVESSPNSAILAGDSNYIVFSPDSCIGGGNFNNIGSSNLGSSGLTIAGGIFNNIEVDTDDDGSTIGGGFDNDINDSAYATITGGRQNDIETSDYAAILNGYECRIGTIAGPVPAPFSTILGGERFQIGTKSVGYHAAADAAHGTLPFVNISAFSRVAYFGNIDTWIANNDGTARKLKFIEPNTDNDYSSANFSSIRAQAQSVDIDYILPAAAGTVDQAIVISAVAGTDVTLTTRGVTRTLFDHFADVGNVGTGEDDLYSDTLAAGRLGTDGDKVLTRFAGIFVGAASSTQQLRAYFGGTLIYDSTALNIGAGITDPWDLDILVIRESATVVRCAVMAQSSGGFFTVQEQYTRVTGLTLANTQIIKITGEAAGAGAANDQIVAKLGYVQFIPAA